ncbi:hypothetical protein SLEP1_g36012 [Rubroshorea leprosula]|uniref:Uncharacterized protein n=1 Tax=Rubroshorea leprosula TaxID=152421 RepID=A0AAV5KQ92_9ROSI|nr:hypothetical protein SLEP1_g36012 [Rubroshorea leprosula]
MEIQQEEGRGSTKQKTKKNRKIPLLCTLRPVPLHPHTPCCTELAPRSRPDSLALRSLPCAPYCVDSAAPLSLQPTEHETNPHHVTALLVG